MINLEDQLSKNYIAIAIGAVVGSIVLLNFTNTPDAKGVSTNKLQVTLKQRKPQRNAKLTCHCLTFSNLAVLVIGARKLVDRSI
jgi:hypothetical protein